MVIKGPRSFATFWLRKKKPKRRSQTWGAETSASSPSHPSGSRPEARRSLSGETCEQSPDDGGHSGQEDFDLRVSALFYPEKPDTRPIPGGLEISPRLLLFECDPRFRGNKGKNARPYKILIETRDIIEAGAVTLPNEESNGERRNTVTESFNYFLQLHIRATSDKPGRLRVLLFKVGTRDVLYEVTTKLVDLIASCDKDKCDLPSRTRIPCESPNIEDVMATVVATTVRPPERRFSDVGGFDMQGVMEHEGEESASRIISPSMAGQITSALPLSVRFLEWSLAYRPKIHGVSMQTFYRQLAFRGPSLLLIRDSQEKVFGAFASETWAPHGKYFGTGESFVFTFDQDGELVVYPWSARNESIQFADESMFAMGGGGSSAIVLQSDFLRGMSQKCTTFLNPQLSTDEDFVVSDLEVWSFQED